LFPVLSGRYSWRAGLPALPIPPATSQTPAGKPARTVPGPYRYHSSAFLYFYNKEAALPEPIRFISIKPCGIDTLPFAGVYYGLMDDDEKSKKKNVMSTRELQCCLCEKLRQLFSACNDSAFVEMEWNIAKKGADVFDAGKRGKVYMPRPDIAVGPFSCNPGTLNYDSMLDKKARLFQALFDSADFKGKYCDYKAFIENSNQNPRCLMAIEIEASGTTKHRLGDMLNAVMLGKVGVVLPIKEKVMASFLRIAECYHEAECVGKTAPGIFKNLLIIDSERFNAVLDSEIKQCGGISGPSHPLKPC